jgi:Na+-translocating ferredoxin:NAD+ oxidoreductase subunit B
MILFAVAALAGVGLVFAIVIAIADRKLRVWEDPRIDAVEMLLPSANCGGCGLPGCRAFAEQAVKGTVKPAQCNVLSEEGKSAIAAYLGVDAGEVQKRVARLLCAGGTQVAVQQAEYRGYSSCAAAAAVAGGGKGCSWGCLGLADCARSCTFGAIEMSADGLPLVDPEKCTACGDCVRDCPKQLFTLLPLDQPLLVQCRSLLGGDNALSECTVACTSCGKCVMDGAPGLISIASGVAVVDPQLFALSERRATERCPTGAIVWLTGAQFAGPGATSPTQPPSARVAPQLMGSAP